MGYCRRKILEPKKKKALIAELIKQKNYELECLVLLQKIMNSGDCNTCAVSKNCEYKPNLGEMVRYNCPFYKDEKVKTVETIFEKGESTL